MRLIRFARLVPHLVAAAIAGLTLACTQTSLTGPDQSAPKCQVGVTSPPNAVAPGGGTGSMAIVAAPECEWRASSEVPWITNLTPASGQGPAQVSFTVGANPAAATRQGEINVNGTLGRVNQDPAPCTYDVSPRTLTVASTTGTGTVTVTTPIGCTWTSASEASWLTITSPAQRTSGGAVTFDYAANPVALPRIGSMTIAGLAVLVTQQAPGCTYVLSPPTQNVVVGGASGTVAVTAGQGCAWIAVSDVPWLTISGTPTGTGTGAVNFSASTNTGSPRTGHITVAGTVASVTQDGVASCQFSINPDNTNIGASGGSGSTALTATAGCSWSVNSNASWIALSSPSTGVSSSTVTFSIGANSGAARQGTLSVAGQTYTVNQGAAPCNYSVNPLTQTVGNGAGSAVVSVTTAPHCAWTSAVNPADTWLRIVGGASVTGNGAVSVNLDAHTGTQTRTGRLTVAGQPVTIDQTGCSYQLSSTTGAVAALGGAVVPDITVTTQAGCGWSTTVAPANTWLHTASGASGNGSGTVSLTADLNPSLTSRPGIVTIANQTVTITQSGLVCSYSINPTGTSPAIGSGGGGGSFNVITTPNLPICSWTASTVDSWIAVTPPAAGAGNGTVNFTVAANGGAARTGSIAVPGAPSFSISQDAFVPPPCVLSLVPTSQNFTSAGGGGSYSISGTVSTCAWTATATDPTWVTVTSGSGSGTSGTVSFTVAANNGAARSTTITIPGQPSFTVSQDAFVAPPCSLSLNPMSAQFTSAGGSGSYDITGNVPTCSWTATATDPSWVTVTSGSGSGMSGTVGFTVSANSGAARSTTITIPGQPSFTVNQDAVACSLTFTPSSRVNAPAAGVTEDVGVTANLPSCTWGATSGDPTWLTINAVNPGMGNGTVNYTLSPNGTGLPRSTTITIGTQSFSVQQDQ